MLFTVIIMSFHTFCKAEPTFPESQENWEKKGDLNEDGNNNFEDINKTLTDISGYFEEHASPTDGNCFYHSIVDYIEGNDNELTKTIFETQEYIDAYDTNSVNFKEVYMFNMHWLRELVWKESLKPLNNEQKGASEETIEFRNRLKEGVDQTISDKNVYYDERGNVDRTKSYGHVGIDLWTMDREIDVTARLLGIDICTLQTIGEELKWVVSLHDPNNAKLDGLVCFLKNNGDHFTNLTYKGNTARMDQLRQRLRADRQKRTAAKTEEKGTPYLSEDLTNTSIKDLKKLIIDYNKKKSKGKRISGHSKLDQSGLVKKIVESGMMKKRPPPRSDKKQNSSNEQKESSNEQKNNRSQYSDDFESMTQNKLKSWIQNYNSEKRAWQQITRYSTMDKRELKDRIRKQIVFDKDETMFDLDRLDPMTMVQLKSWWKYSLYGRTLFPPFFNFKQPKQWVIRYIKSNMSPRVLQDMLLSAFRNPVNQGIGLVKLLLTRKDIDVNQAMNNGETSLIITCQDGRVDDVRLLLARDDIDVNKADSRGRTPLVAACDHDDESKAELARRTQIQQNQLDMQGMEAIRQLLKKENTRLLRLSSKLKSIQRNREGLSLLGIDPFGPIDPIDPVNPIDPANPINPINHVEVVKLLLARDDIDVNKADNDGQTPLYAACRNGNVKVINALLTRKEIQINQAKDNGATPLIISCWNDRVKIVNLLLARKEIHINQAMNDGATPLYMACRNDSVKVVNSLLTRKDIDINQAKNNGETPLYITCEKGHVDVVRLLLARKDIQINQADEDGGTPLWIAQENKHTKIVSILEDKIHMTPELYR